MDRTAVTKTEGRGFDSRPGQVSFLSFFLSFFPLHVEFYVWFDKLLDFFYDFFNISSIICLIRFWGLLWLNNHTKKKGLFPALHHRDSNVPSAESHKNPGKQTQPSGFCYTCYDVTGQQGHVTNRETETCWKSVKKCLLKHFCNIYVLSMSF